jgi:hypothetical protein
VRGDDDGVGELRPQRLDDPPLVSRVDVRVQQAHGDGVVDAVEARRELLDLADVERDERLAGGVEPLVQLEHVAAADERQRGAIADVVHRRATRPADLVDVAESGGRHQRDTATAPFQQGVEPRGRAMDEGRDAIEGDPQAVDCLDHTVGQPARSRQRLGRAHGAVGAGGDGVGERAADVDGEPVARVGRCDGPLLAGCHTGSPFTAGPSAQLSRTCACLSKRYG